MTEKNIVLEVRHLKKYYPVRTGVFSRSREVLKAVDDVSFTIPEGGVLGLVGESGCGKTTVGSQIALLEAPTLKDRAEVLVAITEIELARGGGDPDTTLQ